KSKAPAIAKFRRIVERRGGTILSGAYVNSQTRLQYRCAAGHEWSAVPNSILLGRWCPTCANEHRKRTQHAKRKRAVMLRLVRIARARGGEIISPFIDS